MVRRIFAASIVMLVLKLKRLSFSAQLILTTSNGVSTVTAGCTSLLRLPIAATICCSSVSGAVVAVGAGVLVGTNVLVGKGVAVGGRVLVGSDVTVGGTGVAVGNGVLVIVGVFVGKDVAVGGWVLVGNGVAVGGAGVAVGNGVLVIVGVFVGKGVAVGGWVLVGSGVAVGGGVLVAVSVIVGVAVGVRVGNIPRDSPPACMSARITPNATRPPKIYNIQRVMVPKQPRRLICFGAIVLFVSAVWVSS